jgi:ornithine carbamoyltransferase
MPPPRLIHLTDLRAQDIHTIWHLARQAPTASTPAATPRGPVAWSFEGPGIRTRTSFLQAFAQLGLGWIELPGLLKTEERVSDLASYLDPFYSLYVVRESDHARLGAFAEASARPVINAMSSQGHPCEVLTDAFSIECLIGPLPALRIGLWGPMTNVLRSWHELAQVLGLRLHHFGPPEHRGAPSAAVQGHDSADTAVDLLITDGWPVGFDDPAWSVTPRHLAALGQPRLLPTPPFRIGREWACDPVRQPGFLGHAQKHDLLPVQRALVAHLLEQAGGPP